MALLRDLTASLWNYVSPRKTQQRRDKPYAFKKPALPAPRIATIQKDFAKPLNRDISPDASVSTWGPRTPSPPSDIDATLLPPSPPASAMQSDDFEGDTLLPESPMTPGDGKTGSSADEWDANEETMVVDEGTFMTQSKKLTQENERERRDQQGRELRGAGWTEDAVFLFQKLGMRGFEPILPITWIHDLDSLPEDLFTANVDKAFLKPVYGTDHHAQVALDRLFNLGGFVRDAWHTRAKRTPAFQIEKAAKKYAKWAMKDGRVDRMWAQLPLFEIVAFSHNVATSVGERRMIEKLGKLHAQWQEALQIQNDEDSMGSLMPEVPTLYGITASHSVMAFVSYAPTTDDKEQAQLRLIAMFDFNKEGFDVWNSLALAIFIVHCRNRMMQLKECLHEPEVSTEEDPDL